MDLPIIAWAAIYEEAGRSIFGPLAFNCMAPDDGNMNLSSWSAPATEGKMAEAYCRRQGAIDLYDDRTCAGRRLRSLDDQDPR